MQELTRGVLIERLDLIEDVISTHNNWAMAELECAKRKQRAEWAQDFPNALNIQALSARICALTEEVATYDILLAIVRGEE